MGRLREIPRPDDFRLCYGCGEANPRGLGLSFAVDDDAARVVARWVPPGHFAGYKRMTHGGVISTMLDEAMGWALYGLLGEVGVTRELATKFVRPVFVEREYEILGWLDRRDDDGAVVRAEVRDGRGRLAAEGRGEFLFVDRHKARDREGGER